MESTLNRATNFITRSRVWRSFFRHGLPNNEMDRSLVMTTNLFFHLHPVKVNRRSLRVTYSFGLGIISAILFLTLSVTGVLLVFYYVPATNLAYQTMKDLEISIPLGQLLSDALGIVIFQTPLHYTVATDGIVIWFIVVVVISAFATVLPAQNASRLTVREVLAYE